jgi:tetratricopeptide (TPR) repeat protein
MNKIKILFQIIIILCFLGGIFWVFDDWKAAMMVNLLVVLLVTQILFLSSKLTIKKNKPNLDGEKIANMISTIKGAPVKKQLVKKKKKKKPTKKEDTQIDPNVFSKFQNNLKDSQKNRGDDAIEGEDVVLSLSSKSKKGSAKSNLSKSGEHLKKTLESGKLKPKMNRLKKGGKIKVPTENIDSIFDDMKDAENDKQKSVSKKDAIVNKQNDKGKISKIKPPLISNEMLSSKDFKVLENEAEMVFNAAEKTYRSGNFEEALSSIMRWFQSNYKYNTKASHNKDLAKLKADCEFSLLRYKTAAESYQDYFKRYCKQSDEDYLHTLDDVIDNFSLSIQQKYAIQFMFTALNEHRQTGNQVRMDGIYKEIEQAYRQMEDWPRLIQTYQNHLSIKKMIKDHQGQLEILDHLGKLQYDQGDAAGSKQSYEESMAIKNQIGEI